jgi:hypothetical protein
MDADQIVEYNQLKVIKDKVIFVAKMVNVAVEQ